MDRPPRGPQCWTFGIAAQPPEEHTRRSSTRRGAFMLSRRAVARPVGVRPRICPPRPTKRSLQASPRGLNNAVTVRVAGSMLVRFGPLYALQRSQARARPPGSFDAAVLPGYDVFDMERNKWC